MHDFLVIQAMLFDGDSAKAEAALLAAGLVLADAKAVITRNTGVIAENLERDRAERMQSELSKAEVASEVVRKSEFELGPARRVKHAFLRNEGIVVVDPIEGEDLHKFDELDAVGLGFFGKEDHGLSPWSVSIGSKGNTIVNAPQFIGIHESKLLLHFVARGRAAFELERGTSLCAATEKPALMDSASNFHEFAAALRHKAPNAAFGRGYGAFCSDPKEVPDFQSHHDFLKHVSWLAWKRK